MTIEIVKRTFMKMAVRHGCFGCPLDKLLRNKYYDMQITFKKYVPSEAPSFAYDFTETDGVHFIFQRMK